MPVETGYGVNEKTEDEEELKHSDPRWLVGVLAGMGMGIGMGIGMGDVGWVMWDGGSRPESKSMGTAYLLQCGRKGGSCCCMA